MQTRHAEFPLLFDRKAAPKPEFHTVMGAK